MAKYRPVNPAERRDMSARNDNYRVQSMLQRAGIMATIEQANTLRRAEKTLHRWAELECGDDNGFASIGIERDETTGKPFHVVHPHDGSKSRRWAIPDREAGALRRVAAVCAALGCHYHHQTDPRGCALYVSRDKLADSDYYHGVAVAV